MKKESVLVTGGTSNDVPAIASLLINLKQTNIDLVQDIIIFHDGIKRSEQRLMKKIFPVEFRKYQYPSRNKQFDSVVTNYFHTMVFCKFECFKLLNEYKSVLWTDYDVVILKNLSKLLQNPPEFGFRMIPDKELNIKDMFLPNIATVNMDNYDLAQRAFCTPLFILFDNMYDYNKYYQYCLDKTDQYAPYLYLPEQCAINLLIQDFHITIDPLDYYIYCSHPKKDQMNEQTAILHAYGQPKFWNGLQNEIWNKNYEIWTEMGGRKYIYSNLILDTIKSMYNKVKSIIKNRILKKLNAGIKT